jgi:hypothetical protein
MRLRAALSLFAVAAVPQLLAAQETFTVRGMVVNQEQNIPLQYAVVGIPELEIWDLSDEAGVFELEGVQEGVYRFIALRRGYNMAIEAVNFEGPMEFIVDLAEEDQDAPLGNGNLVGQVVDQVSGRPVDGVEILLVPTEQTATADAQGRFEIEDITSGALQIELRRVGYEPRIDTIAAFPGVTLELTISMAAQPVVLEPMVVTVRSRHLEAAGFYRRARSAAGGRQFTRVDIERRNPFELTQMFDVIPSVRADRDAFGDWVLRSTRGDRCELSVWIDGMRTPGFSINTYPVDWVEALEVYVGAFVPGEFYDPCGVVLIWTRQ